MQTEKVIDHIVNWLKDYATKANMEGFVVGVSGGIDSAVTSSLCAKTGLRTLCVEMPIHQAPDQVTRARKHIEQLRKRFANVTDIEVNLTRVFEEFKSSVPVVKASPQLDLSLANTRARLRMSTLYYFAGLHRYLVAGTGNKVEDFGVGFYTKYGDGGVDLSPIADLLKSQVYELGKALQVPQSIIDAPPTDGLFGDSRSDEDQLGASYDELEWAMRMKDEGKTPEDFTGREKEAFSIFLRFNTVNQHKMLPIPVCNIPVGLL
ncbi:NAD(+) synthase [Aquimarina brevivitae]|uniref:NH(3)-dependent NAD(+) synthetase n=1 Tax=Aquimarina brevivitae TaxID=323412 RepID=A0A4Q7NXS0_9FLAO|nr:NAD(+) synthase [Aquimarina brevivitae]RZS92196.1 NAD+ synthase [Aquimarina brevivitae]